MSGATLSLKGAPRVTVVSPERVEAVNLALAHARARLALPESTLTWRSRPGPDANWGETWWYENGSVEVSLNAASDLSPRQIAFVCLHEMDHVADGQQFCRTNRPDAEAAADAFAYRVTERETQDFYRLDWRRPSMAPLRGGA